ncbi:adenine phosphoribosyltransferase [Gemmatimonadota bacterium]
MSSASGSDNASGIDLGAFIRTIPDFPKAGIQFKDISPLLASPAAFREAGRALAEPWRGQEVTRVVGIEARGFLFAVAVGHELEAGVVMARKPGKLPGEITRVEYELEYGSDVIEIQKDAVGTDDRVVIVDDVLATGGTLGAAVRLVRASGADLRGVSVLIELEELNGRRKVEDVSLHAILRL